MRKKLIEAMLCIDNRLRGLPPPTDLRCFYLANELTPALGRKVSQHTANEMRHLGWVNAVRKVYGTNQRVWYPPGILAGPCTSFDDLEFDSMITSNGDRVIATNERPT